MLGIIFTGGLGPSAQVIQKLLSAEMQKAVIIAADSGLIAAEKAGIKPHWIIGDMDSLGDELRLAAYPQDSIIRHARDKDYTDTELAFTLALEKGCDDIWIVGGGGGRIDHLFGIRSMFERELFPCRWITDAEDIHCIDAGTANCKISLCLEKNALVSVFPLGLGAWEAKSNGLKWPLSGFPWDRGFFGLSNVAVNGEISIIAETGRFMIILPVN